MKILKRSLAALVLAVFSAGYGVPAALAITQTLTVTGAGGVTSGWLAEGGDCTRISSDDEDTTRLYSPTPGDIHVCALSNTSGLSGKTINSATVRVKVFSLDPVSNTFQIGVRISGTNYWSANKDTVTDNTLPYLEFTETWTTNPATGLAWTTSDLDAVEAGLMKVNGAGMRWSYMILDVDYTDAAPPAAPAVDDSYFYVL